MFVAKPKDGSKVCFVFATWLFFIWFVLCAYVCVCVCGGGGGGAWRLYMYKMLLLQVKLPPVPVVTEQESREHLLAAERRRMRFIHTYIISPSTQYYHVDFHSV